MVYNAYRPVVYVNLTDKGVASLTDDDMVRLTAESYPTECQAYGCLCVLQALPKTVKGHLEVEVPGVGWVREEDAETVVHQHRLRESDRQLNGVE